MCPFPALQQLCKIPTQHLCDSKEPQEKDEQGIPEVCQDPRMPTPPLTTDISLLWTFHRPLLLFSEGWANLQKYIQNIFKINSKHIQSIFKVYSKYSQNINMCQIRNCYFFIFLLFESFRVSFLSLSPQVATPVACLCACLCKIHGNADKFIDSRSWRFKKNTQYCGTLNSHKTSMFWMMEFPPLPLKTSPNQVPVYSCCCYSAVLYFHYKTTPFISFLTSLTEEIQRMEVSQFSITLRNMRLMHSCGPLKVIMIVFRKWKGPEFLHTFKHV